MNISHRAGEFLGLSSGCYDDYRLDALYRVLVDFDIAEQVMTYVAQAKLKDWIGVTEEHRVEVEREAKEQGDYQKLELSDYDFGNYLARIGFVERIVYDEVNCTGSADFDIDTIRAHGECRAQEAKDKSLPAENANPTDGDALSAAEVLLAEALLVRCEAFIRGFEDDGMQEGITELLHDLDQGRKLLERLRKEPVR